MFANGDKQMILIGKFKNSDWKEVDRIDSDDQDEMDFLLAEYKKEKGQGWLLKWVEEVEEEKETA